METHLKRSRARILLSSVFGPYAQDDKFGSRSINPMESNLSTPSLTTIRQPMQAMGEAAANLLLESISVQDKRKIQAVHRKTRSRPCSSPLQLPSSHRFNLTLSPFQIAVLIRFNKRIQ